MDREGIPVLWVSRAGTPTRTHIDSSSSSLFMVQIRRPFALINSRMYVHAQESQLDGSHDSSMIVGEVQQEWHPWRRKYNVFKK